MSAAPMGMGRRGAVIFTAAGLASGVWILIGLGPALTAVTAAASGNRCFVAGIAYSWHPPETGAFEASSPVTFAILAGAVVAAGTTGAATLARRLGLSPLVPPFLALVVAAAGLAPFVACRWELTSSNGQYPFILLALGLTAAVACIAALVADWFMKTRSRSAAGAGPG